MKIKSATSGKDGAEDLLQPSAVEHSKKTNELLVLFTASFKPAKSVNVIIYFHGHYQSGTSNFKEFRQHFTSAEMIKAVQGAGKPLALAIPDLGVNADAGDWVSASKDSFDSVVKDTLLAAAYRVNELCAGKKLADPSKHYATGKNIEPLELGVLILTAHSGGGFVMRRLIELGSGFFKNLKEVWMLDSLYDDAMRWASWANLAGATVQDVYTKGSDGKHAPYLNSSKIYEPARKGEEMPIQKPPPVQPPISNLQPAIESTVGHHHVPGEYVGKMIKNSKNL